MAEVGQRLGTGAYRLSALRTSQNRPVRTGESPGPLLVSCTFSDRRIKEDSTQNQGEVQPVSESRAAQRQSEQLSRARTIGSQQENGTLRCATSLELDSSRFTGVHRTRKRLQAHTTALYLSPSLQPLLREKVLPGRMPPWTREAVSIHRDTFWSRQQLRALCTAIFIVAEQGPERAGWGPRQKRLKLHPCTLRASTASRSYSSSKDAPLLYRSRTAYYDVLRVTPSATQAQIKTAYYKQSFIFHPDKNQGDKEAPQRFAEISEAYSVLGSISLRRKYDRGILSKADVQNAGRPSSKETTGRPTDSPQQQHQHQHQQRARRASQAGGRTMFDFDAFYRAHYGEQLQRERYMRARRQRMQEEQKENLDKQKQHRIIDLTVVMLLAMAGLICANFSNP